MTKKGRLVANYLSIELTKKFEKNTMVKVVFFVSRGIPARGMIYAALQ